MQHSEVNPQYSYRGSSERACVRRGTRHKGHTASERRRQASITQSYTDEFRGVRKASKHARPGADPSTGLGGLIPDRISDIASGVTVAW